MSDSPKPSRYTRRSLLRRAFGLGIVAAMGVRAHKAAAEQVQVTIDNSSFSPALKITTVGSTVTWVNEDDTTHRIVFPELNLRSEPLDTDDTFSHQFDEAGTFDYTCSLHPQMHGQIMVE